MKIMHLRVKTLLALGTGFLLGSRAGTGPWNMFQSKLAAGQEKLAEARGGRAPESELDLSVSGDGRLPITSV